MLNILRYISVASRKLNVQMLMVTMEQNTSDKSLQLNLAHNKTFNFESVDSIGYDFILTFFGFHVNLASIRYDYLCLYH